MERRQKGSTWRSDIKKRASAPGPLLEEQKGKGSRVGCRGLFLFLCPRLKKHTHMKEKIPGQEKGKKRPRTRPFLLGMDGREEVERHRNAQVQLIEYI